MVNLTKVLVKNQNSLFSSPRSYSQLPGLDVSSKQRNISTPTFKSKVQFNEQMGTTTTPILVRNNVLPGKSCLREIPVIYKTTSACTPLVQIEKQTDTATPLLGPTAVTGDNRVDDKNNDTDILQQFSNTLTIYCDNTEPIPLSMVYPEFSQCISMEEVISTSTILAPCKFDIKKARAAHRLAPGDLDSNILAADLVVLPYVRVRSRPI